jgi:hypothetical protein
MRYQLVTPVVIVTAVFLLTSPLFAQSVSKAPVTETNACTDADFWIGEWEVREPDDIKIANVSVKAHAGHCVMWEDWIWTVPTERLRGNAGNGLCVLAYGDEKHDWQYDCGTDFGKRYNFVDGRLVGRELRFVDRSAAKGVIANFSYTELPDGRVRENEVESDDGGKTWKTTVDVFWNRRK